MDILPLDLGRNFEDTKKAKEDSAIKNNEGRPEVCGNIKAGGGSVREIIVDMVYTVFKINLILKHSNTYLKAASKL